MYKLGTAACDVTPPLGYRLQGHDDRKGVAQRVHDPLMLKVLAVGNERHCVYVITSDLIYFTPEYAAGIKHAIHDELGIAPEQVMLTAAHVHTGPFMFASDQDDKTKLPLEYLAGLPRKIVETLREATERMESVSLCQGRSEADIGVINRRLVTPYGVEMRPNPAGPVDHDVLTLAARATDGRLLAVLFNYACHPTTLAMEISDISADYPGAAQHVLETRYPGATAFFINGCCGDVRPNLVADDRFRGGLFEDVERMGNMLADAVGNAVERSVPVKDGTVAGRLETLPLPLDPALIPDTPERLEKIAAYHLRRPKRDEHVSGAWYTPPDEPAVAAWKSIMASRLAKGEKLPTATAMEIHVLAVGDVRLVGLGGEIMVEIGRQIKAAAGTPVLIASCANGVVGYIPTAIALEQGGYEAKSFLSRKRPAPYDAAMETILHDRVMALIAGPPSQAS